MHRKLVVPSLEVCSEVRDLPSRIQILAGDDPTRPELSFSIGQVTKGSDHGVCTVTAVNECQPSGGEAAITVLVHDFKFKIAFGGDTLSSAFGALPHGGSAGFNNDLFPQGNAAICFFNIQMRQWIWFVISARLFSPDGFVGFFLAWCVRQPANAQDKYQQSNDPFHFHSPFRHLLARGLWIAASVNDSKAAPLYRRRRPA